MVVLSFHYTTEPSQGRDIDLFRAEAEFESAVCSTDRATLLLLSVKLERTRDDSGLPNCGLQFSGSILPETSKGVAKTHKMIFHSL